MDLLFARVRKITKYLGNDKDFFRQPRWQLASVLETLSGTWPNQNKSKKFFLLLLLLFSEFSTIAAMGNKLRVLIKTDTATALECFILICLHIGLIIKLILALIFQSTRRQIYERISRHFEMITDVDEVTVLQDYANQGFMYTIIYLATGSTMVVVYQGSPILRSFFRYYFLDEELDIGFSVPIDYGFDHHKYWYFVITHFVLHVACAVLIDVSFDLSYILQIRHSQALFKIVGMRLNKASMLVAEEFDNYNKVSDETINKSYAIISSAIDLHSECLEIVDMIEEAYNVNWFIILLINTAMFAIIVHITTSNLHDPLEGFRFVCIFVMSVLHFFVIFSQGQYIIDSSDSVFDACYDCQWYYLPKKSCQLLNVMMIQSLIPCNMTGAKLFPMNMETFGNLLKVGISYYSVFQT